jgi:protoheme IX farnesyltransferase
LKTERCSSSSAKVWTGRQVSLAEKLRGFGALIKSRQTLLLVATGLAGYLSARPDTLAPAMMRMPLLPTAALMLLSLLAAISGTTALNMVADRDIDSRMMRTAWRPLPAGVLSPAEAALFGGVLLAVGLGTAYWLGATFGLIVTAGALIDLVIYTLWLKRRSAWAIIFGGVSGGMPVLAGRVLGIGEVDGLGLLLALSVLLWIPTHIIPFTMKYADDYRRAGVPTWPQVYGSSSARRFIAFANALRAAALVLIGIWLAICPYSLALLALSGIGTIWLSFQSAINPSAKRDLRLFKFASMHMLGSMFLLALGSFL